MPPELPPEAGLDRLELIGRGGFGAVYRAFDRHHSRQVVVKVLDHGPTHPEAGARFERERAALGALSDHPNIVTLHDSGRSADGRPYLVMEYCAGGSLAERIAEAPMDWDSATSIAICLASALHAAHSAGVLHRDVKPENILCADYGDWKLADFGVALLASRHRTATGDLVASFAHAAPETFGNDPSTASRDTYGLASTLYTMMTGTEPYAPRDGEPPLAVIHRIATEPFPDLGSHAVPDEVTGVLETALAKDPDLRHGSALGFAEALNQARVALGHDPIEFRTRPTTSNPRQHTSVVNFRPPPVAGETSTPERGSRPRRSVGVAAALIIACGFGTATYLVSGDEGVTATLAQETTLDQTPLEVQMVVPSTIADPDVGDGTGGNTNGGGGSPPAQTSLSNDGGGHERDGARSGGGRQAGSRARSNP